MEESIGTTSQACYYPSLPGYRNGYNYLQYGFRVAHNTICTLVIEICEAIIEEYSAEVMKCLVTPEDWKSVAEGFSAKWNFPHCVGAIDGKHIAIRCLRNGESLYLSLIHI